MTKQPISEQSQGGPQRQGPRRRAAHRKRDDLDFIHRLARQTRVLFRSCPHLEAERIAAYTAVRGSGRVAVPPRPANWMIAPCTPPLRAPFVTTTPAKTRALLSASVASSRAILGAQVHRILDTWRGADSPRLQIAFLPYRSATLSLI
ncbi:hypothetical protein [Paludibaculum fermentans]|uniref:hypothetical protein n=1 Tax=Paludibaculum fermentans TaxID=1473598 RepID=UPI003EB89694